MNPRAGSWPPLRRVEPAQATPIPSAPRLLELAPVPAAGEPNPLSAPLAKPSEEKAPNSTLARASSDRLRVGLLSGVAGYVDAAGFVSLLGLFPAHVTGELVGFTISLASGRPLKARVLVIPVFVAAVALSVIVARAFRRRGQPPFVALLGLMAIALSLFTLSGFLWPELGHVSHPVPILLLSAVAAMAFQNTFMREAVGTTCPTTVMTGNLTAFVIELVDLFVVRAWHHSERLSDAARQKADARLKLVATALFGFTFGAGLGGWLTGVIGPRSMLLPTLAVLHLAYAARRDTKA